MDRRISIERNTAQAALDALTLLLLAQSVAEDMERAGPCRRPSDPGHVACLCHRCEAVRRSGYRKEFVR